MPPAVSGYKNDPIGKMKDAIYVRNVQGSGSMNHMLQNDLIKALRIYLVSIINLAELTSSKKRKIMWVFRNVYGESKNREYSSRVMGSYKHREFEIMAKHINWRIRFLAER